MMWWYMGKFGNWGWPWAANWMGLIALLAIFDLVLKGFALWRSARAGQKWWFVALILISSAGILPAIYLLMHPTRKSKKK